MKEKFERLLKQLDVECLHNYIQPDKGNYNYRSFTNPSVRTFLSQKMKQLKESEVKYYVLNQQQHMHQYAPEIYFINQNYCLYFSQETGLFLLNNTLSNPISIGLSGVEHLHSLHFYNNDIKNYKHVIKEIKSTFFNYDNKTTDSIYPFISNIAITNIGSLLLKENLNENNINNNTFDFCLNKKNGIKQVVFKDNEYIAEINRSFISHLHLDENFKLKKVTFRPYLVNQLNCEETIKEIKDFNEIEFFLNEHIELKALITEENISVKYSKDKLTSQIECIKKIVEQKQKITDIKNTAKNIMNSFHYNFNGFIYLDKFHLNYNASKIYSKDSFIRSAFDNELNFAKDKMEKKNFNPTKKNYTLINFISVIYFFKALKEQHICPIDNQLFDAMYKLDTLIKDNQLNLPLLINKNKQKITPE